MRRMPIVMLYVVTALWAVGQLFAGSNGLAHLTFTILFSVLTTVWIVLDGQYHGKPILHIVQLIILFTWPLSVPLYLIATRKSRGLKLLVIHMFGLSAITCLFFYGAILLFWGPTVFYVGEP